MSIDTIFNGIQSVTSTIQTGINTVTRTAADLGLGGVGSSGTYWKDQLRPATYAGVPFGVLGGSIRFGRRNAVHEYPFRDTVWVEDLGRAARRINMTGFLVENGAYLKKIPSPTSVIAQRERLIAACESALDGELVHPTLGRLKVSNLSVSAEERWDQGRVFELNFSFIESGKRIFPSVATSTGDAVSLASTAADVAASADFGSAVGDTIKQGASVVSQAVSTAAAWGRKAQKLANDATNIFNMVGTLKGGFGRYFGGRSIGGLTKAVSSLSGAATSVAGLIALGANARNAVSAAVSKLSTFAAGLGS